MSLSVAVLGPCLMDLKDLVKTDTKHIGIIYTARSIGCVIGSILTGIILDATKYKQAVITVCNILFSATVLTIPWSKSLAMLAGCIFVCGVMTSIMLIGGNVLCLTLWGSDSAPYIHALHFAFGLGALLAPLIAAPFLGDHRPTFTDVINSVTYSTNFSSTYNYTSIPDAYNITSVQSRSKIVYPFSIIGLYSVVVSVMSLLICIISPTNQQSRSDNQTKFATPINIHRYIIALGFLFIFVTCVLETGYAQMLTTYVVNGYVKLSTSAGSYMTSIFWIAFTVSRLAVVFIAIKLSHFMINIISLIVISAGSFILVFYAYSEWALWVSSILLGAGVGPTFAATVGWVDEYISMTNRIVAIFGMAISTGYIVIPFTIGYFTETLPDVFIYIMFAVYILSCLIFLLLFLTLRKREKKM